MTQTQTDPFVRLVSEAREQGKARDSLIARVTASYAPIPRTSATQTITPEQCEAREARADAIGMNVRALVTRHKRNLRSRVRAGLDEAVNRETPSLEWWHRNIPAREARCDGWRGIVAFIRNSEAREALVASGHGLPENPEAREHRQTVKVRRGYAVDGAVQAPERRVNVRGAYGKRGIKGTAARVSQRDTRTPVTLLRNLQTVGIATNLESLGLDRHAMLIACRKDSRKCTVRVYPGDGTASYVALVRDYRELREARKAQAREARLSDVQRYAHIVGHVPELATAS